MTQALRGVALVTGAGQRVGHAIAVALGERGWRVAVHHHGSADGASDTVDRIRDSNLLEVVLTDSVPLPAIKRLPKITTLSVAPLIGEAIKRIHRGESVGALFSSEVSFTQEMLLWEDGQQRRMDTRHEPDHEADGGANAGDDDSEDDPVLLGATGQGDR